MLEKDSGLRRVDRSGLNLLNANLPHTQAPAYRFLFAIFHASRRIRTVLELLLADFTMFRIVAFSRTAG